MAKSRWKSFTNGAVRMCISGKDNVWLRTEWDVRKSELPAAVMNQLNVSYPSWKIDDAEYVETPSGAWFVIELEKGEAEVEIKLSADGVILK